MTYKQALNKINKLLGLHKFNSYKIKENGQELIVDGELAVGEPVYIISDNGQLPAPDGKYELEDTTQIKIENGELREIKYDMEQKQNFVEAALADGTIVKSPTFDVGEEVKVVSPDGKESPAPDGEHELKLKDSEGKEVLIKIITKDGKIVERENVELPEPEEKEVEEEMGMVPALSDGNDSIDFKKAIMEKIESLMAKIEDISKVQEEMKAKVAKFSKEPAGEPVHQSKNVVNEFNSIKNEQFATLMKIRHGLK